MKKVTLKAGKRELFGRKVKKLRREGVIPANIYGRKVKSVAVEVSFADFMKVYESAGGTNVIGLVLAGKTLPVLVHSVQYDPVTDAPIHVDLLKVNLKEKVTAHVPVELVGESPAVKLGLGTLVEYIDGIEVEALPNDLVDKFEVELTKLENVDDMVKVKDLKVDKKKIDIKEEADSIIVKIEPLRKEEEPTVPEPREIEGEEKLDGEGVEEKPEEKGEEGEVRGEKSEGGGVDDRKEEQEKKK